MLPVQPSLASGPYLLQMSFKRCTAWLLQQAGYYSMLLATTRCLGGYYYGMLPVTRQPAVLVTTAQCLVTG